MTLDDLVNAAEPFKLKNGVFTGLDQLKTEDLVPFRGPHDYETCLHQTKNGSTYLNHFYFWKELELCCQTASGGSVLILQLQPSVDRTKNWPINICILRVDVSEYELSCATPESRMNYVVCLNNKLLQMANAITNADTAWVLWENRKVSRNPKSPGAILAKIASGAPAPSKKKWWNF